MEDDRNERNICKGNGVVVSHYDRVGSVGGDIYPTEVVTQEAP